MAIKKKATVAKSADAARKGAMTKTVVRKVSPDVKIIKAGSKPLTQSLSEKRAIMEKAKGKTPAARAKAASEKKSNIRYNTREQGRARQSILNATYREALKSAGYQSPQFGMGPGPTAAQTKAANKAVAAAEKKIADAKKAAKAADNAKRGQSSKGGKSSRGGARGGGLGGGFGMGSGGGSGRSNVNR
jgi:uncharacterized membrane protein YgcG